MHEVLRKKVDRPSVFIEGMPLVFSQMIDEMSQKADDKAIILKATSIDTVIGPLLAIADEDFLYLLEFATKGRLEKEIGRLKRRGFTILPGETRPLKCIKAELKAYFAGAITQFTTPFRMLGSAFQQEAWQALCRIPFGETRSYAAQAASLGKPKSCRAVGNANGANQLSIIIPCHRVIASDGTLGGYGGGLPIKQWLLQHEQRCKKE